MIYPISDELFLYILQTLKPFTPNADAQPIRDLVRRMEEYKKDTDSSAPKYREGILEVKNVLDDMFRMMQGKGHDYSGSEHTFTSFERAAELWGLEPQVTFFILIGVKMSRIRSLTSTVNGPVNESLADSWMDMANYIVLYLAYQRWLQQKEELK